MSPNRRRKPQLRIILKSLDTLSGVLLYPFDTFQQITSSRPVGLALLTAVSVAIVTGLVLVPNPPELAEVILDQPKGTLSLWVMLPIWVVLFMAVLCSQAAFVHVMAVILKSKGSCLGVFCGLCFAYIPGLFAAPLVMLRAVFSSDSANAFYQVTFPLLCLWVFILGIAAVQRTYGMSRVKAVFVCSLALVALVVLPMVIAVIVMTQVMT